MVSEDRRGEPSRALHFPDNYSVGRLVELAGTAEAPVRRLIGECQGAVSVPRSAKLHLYWHTIVHDMSPLTALDPDDLYGFSYPKIWEGDDDSSLQFVSHLTGLYVLLTPGDYTFFLTEANATSLLRLTNLDELYLDDTGIQPGALQSVGSLGSLHFLSLDGDWVYDEGVSQLTGLKELKTLSLFDAHVTDEGLAQLAQLQKLRKLGLGGNEISGRGLKQLTDLPELESLGLSHVDGISDEDLRILRYFPSIRELNLFSTTITDGVIQYLANLSNLRELNVSSTGVTEEGVAALHRALPKCRIFSDLGYVEPER
jgi:hypothetical protein